MKTNNLKLPLILRSLKDLDDAAMDLGEWKPEIEARVGLGPWTFSDICRIVKFCLDKSGRLLAEINGIKLNKEDRSDLAEYRTFFKEYKELWQEAKGKCAQKGAQNGIRS